MTQLANSLGTVIGAGFQKQAAFPKFLAGLTQKLPAMGTALADKAGQGRQWAASLGSGLRNNVSHLGSQLGSIPTRVSARGQNALRGAMVSGGASAATSALTGNPVEPGVVGTSMMLGGLMGGARTPNYKYSPSAAGKMVPSGAGPYSMQQGLMDAAPGTGLSLLRGQVRNPAVAAQQAPAVQPAPAAPAAPAVQQAPEQPPADPTGGQSNWMDSLPSWAIPAGAAALAAPLAGSLMSSTTDEDNDNRGLLSALGMLGGGAGAAYLAHQYSPEIRQFLSGLGQQQPSAPPPEPQTPAAL